MIQDFSLFSRKLPGLMFLLFFFAGENATLSCKIGSVPTSKVRWYRDGTEVLNNSLVNRGQQKFVIFERGGFEKTSSLILTNARAEDSGPFMCVSNNQAQSANSIKMHGLQ